MMVQLHGFMPAAKFVVLRIRPKTELRSTRARVPLGWVTLQLESCGFIDKKLKLAPRAPISFVTGEHEGAGGSVLFEIPVLQ